MRDRTAYDTRTQEIFHHFKHNMPACHRAWHTREYTANKTRLPPEWGCEDFWFGGYSSWKYHFVHVSEQDPSLLAYTSDDDKGERNIQTQIKPGRYLKQFFGHTLNDKEIANYASWHANGSKPKTIWDAYELKFADTPEEISRVYRSGPASCMDGKHFRYATTHPARVYGAGDLAVAYLEGKPPERSARKGIVAVARALVWPDKKIYSRIYPTPDAYPTDGFASTRDSHDCQNALGEKLHDLGFRFAMNGTEFNGAKLLKIKKLRYQGVTLRKGVLLPFIDGGYSVTDENTHLLLNRRGDFKGSTTGCTELRFPYDCKRCGKNISLSETRGVQTEWVKASQYWLEDIWCGDCANTHAFRCAGGSSGALYADTVPHETRDGQIFTVKYLEERAEYEKQRKRDDKRRAEQAEISRNSIAAGQPSANALEAAYYASNSTFSPPTNWISLDSMFASPRYRRTP